MTDDERFAPTGGKVSGVLGLALAVSILGTAALADDSRIAPWGIALALLIAAVSWTAMLRPGLAISDGLLVMRNMFTTISIPLRLIDSVVVRQVTAVMVGEKRYVCAAVGRNRGQLKRDQPKPTPGGDNTRFGALSFGAFGLSARVQGTSHESARGSKEMSYGFYVEQKLRRAADETTRPGSDADADDPRQVQLKVAWLEVVMVLGTTVAFIVLLAG